LRATSPHERDEVDLIGMRLQHGASAFVTSKRHQLCKIGAWKDDRASGLVGVGAGAVNTGRVVFLRVQKQVDVVVGNVGHVSWHDQRRLAICSRQKLNCGYD